ncbi:DUF6069 family protein [Actinosynnema sp. NPDC020468]|uniref:DUF6069 family protein n=1 Tax=Actinosynnema sp. NPDC020468 TaxID=3154488 RepID=UPI0033E4CEFA
MADYRSRRDETPEETSVLPQQGEWEPQPRRVRPERRYDTAKLWAGGAATALVAGLVAVVGILFARGLLGIAVLAPKGEGAWGNANTLTYALVTAACALAATGLVQLLLATTPNATRFFTWIMVLLTAIAVVLPLSLTVEVESRVFTAILNALIGLAITGLVVGVASNARLRWTD